MSRDAGRDPGGEHSLGWVRSLWQGCPSPTRTRHRGHQPELGAWGGDTVFLQNGIFQGTKMSFSVTQVPKKCESLSTSGKYAHKRFTKNLLDLVTFPQPVGTWPSAPGAAGTPLPGPGQGRTAGGLSVYRAVTSKRWQGPGGRRPARLRGSLPQAASPGTPRGALGPGSPGRAPYVPAAWRPLLSLRLWPPLLSPHVTWDKSNSPLA